MGELKGRIAFLTEKEKLEVKEFTVPNINDDEILLKVEGCGICGTDAHEFKRDPFGLIPVVLGHEGSGEIIKLGKNVKRDTSGKPIKVGDKLVTSVLSCGECYTCKNTPGRTNLCENLGVYGLFKDDDYKFNGYFADYLIIRKNSTFFNVTGMDLDSRLLIEPAAVVVHSFSRARATNLIDFSGPVLVQGCGPIGLLQMAVVRASGVENIIAVDANAKRLELAKEFGADVTIDITKYNSNDEVAQAVKDVTGVVGAKFAFQCTGVPAAASNIWKFIRRGGGLCEVGFFLDGGDAKYNPHFDMCNKEVTVVGSWVYSAEEYPIAIDFLKRAKGIGLPIDKLVTHHFNLDDVQKAMETNISMTGIKIAVVTA